MSIQTIIVDDVDLARERIKILLDDDELEIVGECANGREAVKAINSANLDLVFLFLQYSTKVCSSHEGNIGSSASASKPEMVTGLTRIM